MITIKGFPQQNPPGGGDTWEPYCGICINNGDGDRVEDWDVAFSGLAVWQGRDTLDGTKTIRFGLSRNAGSGNVSPGAGEDDRFADYRFQPGNSTPTTDFMVALPVGSYLLDIASGVPATVSPTTLVQNIVYEGTGDFGGTTRVQVYASPHFDAQTASATYSTVRAAAWFSQIDWLARAPNEVDMQRVDVTDRSGESADATGLSATWQFPGYDVNHYFRLNYIKIWSLVP